MRLICSNLMQIFKLRIYSYSGSQCYLISKTINVIKREGMRTNQLQVGLFDQLQFGPPVVVCWIVFSAWAVHARFKNERSAHTLGARADKLETEVEEDGRALFQWIPERNHCHSVRGILTFNVHHRGRLLCWAYSVVVFSPLFDKLRFIQFIWIKFT